MTKNCGSIQTKEQMHLEIQLIINRRLYEKNVIDKFTYETVMTEVLKAVKTIKTV